MNSQLCDLALSVPVLEIVKDGPEVLADVEAVRVADRDGGVGDFGGGHGESCDGHSLRKVIPVGERVANLQMKIHLL